MGRKSRHYRDESDPLLGIYSQTLAAASSVRNSNPLYSYSHDRNNRNYTEDCFSSKNQPSQDEALTSKKSRNLFSRSNNKNSSAISVNDESSQQYTNGTFAGQGHLHHKIDASTRVRNDGSNQVNITAKRSSNGNSSRSNHKNSNNNNNKKNNNNKRSNTRGKYRVHRVSYTAQNHVQVLFRVYGSAFPQVLPFCLLNVIWSLVIYFLQLYSILDLTFHSSVGHSFMGLLVSFLIVSRSKISYDRFMDFRRHLATTYRTCRELAQLTTVYTFRTQTLLARNWRQDVCFRTILLLRVTMDALLWSSTERDQWEDEFYAYQQRHVRNGGHNESHHATRIDKLEQEKDNLDVLGNIPMSMNDNDLEAASAERRVGHDDNKNGNGDDDERTCHRNHVPSFLSGKEEEEEEDNVDKYDDDDDENVSEHFFQFRTLTHGRRSNIDEHYRAPISFAHVLRQTIMEHPSSLGYTMAVNEYRDLILLVGQFMDAFHAFRVLIFTPYPFPLVQMTRAFLFFWVYTLPMVLLKEYRLWSSILIVILVTIGFVGIEYVSMALDDPFGDDTNDVDEHGMALLVYEDIYMTLYRTDGYSAALELRERVLERYKQGRGLDCYRDDLKGYDFWEPHHLRRRYEGGEQEEEEAEHHNHHNHQQEQQQGDHDPKHRPRQHRRQRQEDGKDKLQESSWTSSSSYSSSYSHRPPRDEKRRIKYSLSMPPPKTVIGN